MACFSTEHAFSYGKTPEDDLIRKKAKLETAKCVSGTVSAVIEIVMDVLTILRDTDFDSKTVLVSAVIRGISAIAEAIVLCVILYKLKYIIRLIAKRQNYKTATIFRGDFMYYDKKLFLDQQVKKEYAQTKKLQTAWFLVCVFLCIAILVAFAFLPYLTDTGNLMIGYIAAIVISVLHVLILAATFPFQRKLDSLRKIQTEELKDRPIYGKYAELLNSGRKMIKTDNLILLLTSAVTVAAVWALAVVFPCEFYNISVGTLIPILANLVRAVRRERAEQIKSLEKEILRELTKNNVNN